MEHVSGESMAETIQIAGDILSAIAHEHPREFVFP